MYRDGCVALPRGAMGLSSVCDCYIRNQATGVSLAGRYWAVMGCWLDIAVIWLVCGKKKNQHTKRL